MYKLDSGFIAATLQESVATTDREKLEVYALEDIPADWRAHLVE